MALLTSYSCLRLTLRYPSEGGTVEFLKRAFGGGIFTSAAKILLLISYLVLVSVYAVAFGSYAVGFFPAAEHELWTPILVSGVIVALLTVNVFASSLVMHLCRECDGVAGRRA